jgi:hypothetical protein
VPADVLSMRSAGLLLALVFVAIAGSARPAAACSCKPSGPACHAFWSTPVVFDGVVRSIGSNGMATLDVRQVWKGKVQARTTIPSGGMCGYSFRVGGRYLVFARQAGSELDVGCTATREWDGSGRDMEFLASLSKPATGGRIFGTVRHSSSFAGSLPEKPDVPVATSVRLTGRTGQRTAVSTRGQFEFSGLAAGAYRLHVDVPPGVAADWNDLSVKIAHDRDCSSEEFVLRDNGRIAGRLAGRAGDPLPERVNLTTAQSFPDFPRDVPVYAAVGVEGLFEVRTLPPGDYLIGVNLKNRFIPTSDSDRWKLDTWLAYSGGGGHPRVFTIRAGERVDLGTWKLPAPARNVTASGFMTWEDGRPAVGVVLRLIENTIRTDSLFLTAEVTTEADGHFSMPLLAGRSYRFTAKYKGKDATLVVAPALAIGTQPPPPVRIVVRRHE